MTNLARRARRSPFRRPLGPCLALSLLAFAAACTDAAPETGDATDSNELSSALAFRDGEPTIRFVSPTDGQTVSGPVRVEIETSNIELAPSGSSHDGEGHWHLLIDRDCIRAGELIPSEVDSVHVGSGEASAEFSLAPGRHELCAQVGDGFHVAVAITDSITINVAEPVTDPAAP